MSLSILRVSAIQRGPGPQLAHNLPTLPSARTAILVLVATQYGNVKGHSVAHNQTGAAFTQIPGAYLDNGSRHAVDAFLLDANSVPTPSGTFTISVTSTYADELQFVVVELSGAGAVALEAAATVLNGNWGGGASPSLAVAESAYTSADNIVFSWLTGRCDTAMTLTKPAAATLIASRAGTTYGDSASGFCYQTVASTTKVSHAWDTGTSGGIGYGVLGMVVLKGGVFVPAVLSSPGCDTITDGSAHITAISDIGGGTYHAVASSSATQPTEPQIKAGSGGGIVSHSSAPLVPGANAAMVSGLSPTTPYYGYAMADTGADSNIVSTGSFTTTALAPVITGVSDLTPQRGDSLVISSAGGATGFGTTSGSVVIGGNAATVTAWGDTGVTVTVPDTQYGVPLTVVVTNGATGLASAGYALTSISPPTGYAYVVLAAASTTPGAVMLEADPPLAASDQAEHESLSGAVIINPNHTLTLDPSVTEFNARIWTPVNGWGAWRTITINGGNALTGAALVVASANGVLNAPVMLSGSSVSVSSAGGVLTAQIRLAGAALAQAAAIAGLLPVSSRLAGTAAGVSSSSAVLTTQVRLGANAAAMAGVTGVMTTAIPLSGEAIAATVAAGGITTSISFTGEAAAQSNATGSLSDGISMSGGAVVTATAGADLTTQAAGADLAGGAMAQAQAGAWLATGIPLAGAAITIAAGGGQISTSIPLVGAAAAASSANGNITTTVNLSGAAIAQAISMAALSTGIAMSEQAVAISAADGTLATAINLIAEAKAAASSSGLLGGVSATLAASAAAQASASGAITATSPVAGNAAAQSSSSATLTAHIQFSGAAIAQAVAAAGLNSAIRLVGGDAAVRSYADGALTTSITLSAEALASAIVSGALTIDIPLAGLAAAQSGASGGLSAQIQMVGAAPVRASASSFLGDVGKILYRDTVALKSPLCLGVTLSSWL